MNRFRDTPLTFYAVAVASVLVATAARAALYPWVGPRIPYATFFPAIMVAAVVGGIGPGLLALALSSVAAAFWIEPVGSFRIHEPLDLFSLYAFLAVGVVLAVTGEWVVRTRSAARASADAERRAMRREAEAYSRITDGFVAFDAQLRYTHVNPPAEALLGRRAAELIGRRVWDAFPEAVGTDHDRALSRAMAEQVPVEFEAPSTSDTSRTLHVRVFPSPDGLSLHFRDVTEERRAAQEARLQSRVLQNMSEGVSVSDENGVILFTNPAEDRMFGYGPGELVGQHVTIQNAYEPPENARRVSEVIGQLKAHGVWTGEWHNRRKDGSTFYTFAHITALEEAGRRYWVCVQRDVTEWKRSEEARATLAAIVESSDDAILGKSLDGMIRSWNEGARRLYGYEASEVLGRPVTLLLPPERLEEESQILHRLQRGERIEHFETVRVAKDGRRIDVSLTVSPIRDASGQVIGASKIARDITGRRAAREALRESEERLRLALDAGSIGVWDWDVRSGRVTWSDRVYELHGVPPGRFAGSVEAFAELIHPEDRGRVVELIRRSVEEGTPYENVAFRVVHAGGEVRWLTTSASVFRDKAGRVVRMLGATSDATDRRRAEEHREALLAAERAARSEAERVNRMKDEFLATLSHELRTPLNAILGWSQVLRAAPGDPADLAQGLEAIERNARAQTQLISDLLDMSRIVSGKVRLDVRRVDLPSVIGAAVESVRPSADAKGVRLQQVLDPLAGPIRGDPGRLQQVVWNLLSNAIKFTPRGGRVQVLLERVNSHLELTVVDTGAGISPSFLPHVFERFRQADASTTRRHGGLGLGLSIVKQLVELHGGTVRAESAGEGQGAAFVVSLPLGAVLDPADGERAHPAADSGDGGATGLDAGVAPAAPSLRGLNVLVVDDEPDARVLLARVLGDRGAAVVTASSADEALEALDRGGADVLVCDIGMPDVDGYELLRRVRARGGGDRGGDIPAVALTAFARHEDRLRALQAGFQMHVAKPAEPAELVTVVASVAGRLRGQQTMPAAARAAEAAQQ